MMRLKDIIVVIYAYTGLHWDGGKDKKSFYLSYCFGGDGLVDWKLLKEIYDHTFLTDHSYSNYTGPFDEFADMVKFGVKLCEKVKKEKCILLSVEHYNSSFEKSLELEELVEHIIKKGVTVENPSHKKDWKLLGRIFN